MFSQGPRLIKENIREGLSLSSGFSGNVQFLSPAASCFHNFENFESQRSDSPESLEFLKILINDGIDASVVFQVKIRSHRELYIES